MLKKQYLFDPSVGRDKRLYQTGFNVKECDTLSREFKSVPGINNDNCNFCERY